MARTEQLEQTIMEFGTELIKLKGEIIDVKASQNRFVEVINGLKLILDEKGIINVDDFDNTVDALNLLPSTNMDYTVEEELKKLKKVQH